MGDNGFETPGVALIYLAETLPSQQTSRTRLNSAQQDSDKTLSLQAGWQAHFEKKLLATARLRAEDKAQDEGNEA